MADLSFQLDFDVRSDGLRSATSLLGAFRAELQQGQRAILSFDQSTGQLSAKIESIGGAAGKASGGLGSLKGALMGVGAALATVAAGIALGITQLDKLGDASLQAFGERSRTIKAYTTLLGDAQKAETEFGKAQNIAAMTDLTGQETVKAQQQLFVAGFRGQQADSTLLAGLDLASISTGDPNEALKSFARATGQIKQKGKLQQEELLQLAEGSSLSSGLVKEELRKSLGLKSIGEVDKRQAAGQIDADTAISAIQRAVLAQLGTSKLGEFATSGSGSIQSLISNRDEAFSNLLKSFDSEVIPAVGRYRESLKAQGDVLAANSASGQGLTLVLQDLGNTSLNLKTLVTEFSTAFLDSFQASYGKVLEEIGISQESWDRAGVSAADLGATLGDFAGDILPRILRGFEQLGPLIDAAAEAVSYLGSMVLSFRSIAAFATGDFEKAKQLKAQVDLREVDRATRTPERLAEEKRAKAEAKARKDLEDQFAAGGEGAGQGGGASPFNPFGAQPLKNLGKTKGSGAGGGGSGKGSKGGGGQVLSFGDAVSFAPEEAAGIAPLGTASAVQEAARVAAQAAGQPQTIQVTVVINDADRKTTEELVQEGVTELAKRLGRLVRTPSPGRS